MNRRGKYLFAGIFGMTLASASLLAQVAPPPVPPVALTPQPVPAPAATPATNAVGTGPKIQFAEPIFDFGKIKAGDIVKHTFSFTNVGDQTLEIVNVQPTCGCTAAADWSRKVEPGQSGSIPLQFNSTSFNGAVHKTIPVTCNDRSQPMVVLQIKANIWRPVDVLPQFAMLNVPADLATATTEVKIVSNVEEPLTLTAPEVNNPAFSATLSTNVPGKEYVVKIAVNPPLPAGNAQGLVTLKTSSTNLPVVNITAWANITPAIMVMPPMVSLPTAPLSGKAIPTITIQNNSTNALTLSEPILNLPGVDLKLSEISTGRVFNATLTFPEGFELPQGQQVALTLKTSNPRQPTINVPIVQQPRPPAPLPVSTPVTPAPGLRLQGVPTPTPPAPQAPQAAPATGHS